MMIKPVLVELYKLRRQWYLDSKRMIKLFGGATYTEGVLRGIEICLKVLNTHIEYQRAHPYKPGRGRRIDY